MGRFSNEYLISYSSSDEEKVNFFVAHFSLSNKNFTFTFGDIQFFLLQFLSKKIIFFYSE